MHYAVLYLARAGDWLEVLGTEDRKTAIRSVESVCCANLPNNNTYISTHNAKWVIPIVYTLDILGSHDCEILCFRQFFTLHGQLISWKFRAHSFELPE